MYHMYIYVYSHVYLMQTFTLMARQIWMVIQVSHFQANFSDCWFG